MKTLHFFEYTPFPFFVPPIYLLYICMTYRDTHISILYYFSYVFFLKSYFELDFLLGRLILAS